MQRQYLETFMVYIKGVSMQLREQTQTDMRELKDN